MATKLTRQTQQQFGATVNPASEVGEYGSGALGTPMYTGSITLMQSLTAWSRGWAAETIANNRPFLEDMNAVDCVFGYQISYLLQQGLAEYDAGTTYFLNSLVMYSGTVYQVINDASGAGISGTLPTNGTYWKLAITPISGILGAWTTITLGTIYQAPTDGFLVGYIESNGGGTPTIEILTDVGSTPSVNRSQATTSAVSGYAATAFSPVRKNDYYQMNNSDNGHTLSDAGFFIPMGS